MKKTIFITIAFLVVILCGSTKQSSASTIWQIGQENSALGPIPGSLEFPADGIFTSYFTYVVGTDVDSINNPSAPGYLSLVNLADIDPLRPPVNTTTELEITFHLDQDYTDLFLYYGRWGSENDKIASETLDFEELVPGLGENVYANHIFDLGSAASGDHSIEFVYLPTGANNGHYIDYLRLEGNVVPEPSSLLLLGSGFAGLMRFRKKKILLNS